MSRSIAMDVTGSFQTFGALLRFLRRRMRLTQQQLGAAVGYSTPQISLLENDQRLPDLTTLAALFVPALDLQEQPEMLQRLMALAAAARGASGRVTITRTTRRKVVVTETEVIVDGEVEPGYAMRLPAPALPLIGRDDDLAASLAQLLEPGARLLTLVGPPGVGKTRLALQIAWTVRDTFPDGAHFVELAAVTDPAQVAPAIARSLGLRAPEHGAGADALQGLLRDKRMLLVLDNVEQVLDAAPMVADLLAAAPGIKVLATSRELMRLYGEHEYAVPPLALPDLARLPSPDELAEYASVALFVARARAVQPGFKLTTANAVPVAAVCVRLDGLPLAIELAAAQCGVLSPQELAARLIASANRLPALRQRARNLPARHQTLRDAIHWSYQQLSPDEQRLFTRLGVFVGSFDVEAVQAVLGEERSAVEDISWGRAPIGESPIADLQSLLGKSLVQRLPGSGDSPRFTLLETLREYALDRLATGGEDRLAREGHAAHFLAVAEEVWQQHARGPKKQAWLARLERDEGNLRAALLWLLQSDTEAALRMAGALEPFWNARGGYTEARAWLKQALAQSCENTPSRARALLGAAVLAQVQGDCAESLQLAESALAIYRELGDRPSVARALRACGWAIYDMHASARAILFFEESLAMSRALGDSFNVAKTLNELAHVMHQPGINDAQTTAHLQESLAIFRELDWPEGIASALVQQGIVETSLGRLAGAEGLYMEALALFEALGVKREVAWALSSLGEVAGYQDRWAEALARCERALRMFEEMGVTEGIAIVSHHIGHVHRRAGRLHHAQRYLAGALRMAREHGNNFMVARCLAGLGGVALAQGQPRQAAVLLGGAFQWFDTLPPFLAPADRVEYSQLAQAACEALGEPEFQSAWDQGRALPAEELLALSRTLAHA